MIKFKVISALFILKICGQKAPISNFQPICKSWGITKINETKVEILHATDDTFIPDNYNFNPCPEGITDPNAASTQCCRDWLIWLDDLKKLGQARQYLFDKRTAGYANYMCDSWGTIESGYLMGNFRGEGRFDECTKHYRVPEEYTNVKGEITYPDDVFKGKYCNIFPPTAYKEGSGSKNERQREFKTVSRQYGICIPDSCTEEDIDDIANI